MIKNKSDKGSQHGQGMTEYIIIVAVIAISAIGAFSYFGDVVETQVANMGQELSGEAASNNAPTYSAQMTSDGNALATYKDNH